jgi:uncharacterized protein YqeY
MSKRTEITDAMKEAMKAKETMALSTIRLINAAIKDRDIAARTAGNPDGISDADILSMMQTMIKQRVESADIYTKNARPELAEQELAEIEVIKRFLPAQMSEDEVKAKINEIVEALGVSDMKDMGKVMAELKAKYAGQMDMGKASGLIKARLSA